MKEGRSSLVPENLQEVLDAEQSAAWATNSGFQQQYFTPIPLAEQFAAKLPNRNPESILDPQCGEGATVVNGYGWRSIGSRYGLDMDNRLAGAGLHDISLIVANCVKFGEALDDLYPDLRWETVNANPPFGKRWKQAGEVIDSTEWTWDFVTRHGCAGYFIANYKTIERMGIDKHPYVYSYSKHENVWKNCEVVIGVVHWKRDGVNPTPQHELREAWGTLSKVIEEEKGTASPWNIWLDDKGCIKTYLSTRTQTKRRLKREELLKLAKVTGSHPLVLTTEKETRVLLQQLVECGFYTIEPKCRLAIADALTQVHKLACPLMPVKDFCLVAWADEQEQLRCKATASLDGMTFTGGKDYDISTATYKFREPFKARKVHHNEKNNETYTVEHDCELSGQDRYIQVTDDSGKAHRFMDRPRKNCEHEHAEALIWDIFEKPTVNTVAETCPEQVAANRKILKACELMGGYSYYESQADYLARVATKDYALIAAETGVGKTLFAITLMALKGPKRALIIAPVGTMKSSDPDDDDDPLSEEYHASQWSAELSRFAPYLQVFSLFSMEDYYRIKSLNGGELPAGCYVSYPHAAFLNGARESCPASWDDQRLSREGTAILREGDRDRTPIKLPPGDDIDTWAKTIGREVNGIRCIMQPSLSTLIGEQFDAVLLDEAHAYVNLTSTITQLVIRMQPKYRYCLTASPITNTVTNLFSLIGWLAIPDWYKGGRRSASWPYAREEAGRFEDTFRSEQRDFTQESMNKQANRDWKGKCVKLTPVISSPARLLKITSPTLAYLSKEQCNPKLVKCKVTDLRVPLGKEQAQLYAHFLNRSNIDCKHPLIRARKQIAYLRNICADPAGFEHGGPVVRSGYNPKTAAILELTRTILARQEQVVIINSRIGQTSMLQSYLEQAGITIARIDSTIPADQHAMQSNRFKAGAARVLLMGIKCAVGHSYSSVPNMIIGSLDYSWGSLVQAMGRVFRVNSEKDVNVYCVLHANSIEEVMWEVCNLKGDAAVICLRGERLPRTFRPVEPDEVLALAIDRFAFTGATPETQAEANWPKLRDAIRQNVTLK